jgi:hypothetical protein
MDIRIDIEPTEEAKEAVLTKYKTEELSLPAEPKKGRGTYILIFIIGLIYIGIPSLVLLILRIPLRIIRQLRKWTAPRKFYRDHIKLYKDEYEWREKPTLEFPERKQTKRQTKKAAEREKRKEELKKYGEELKLGYTGELSTMGYAFDYATYCSTLNYDGGSAAIYILDQFKEKLFDLEGRPKAALPETITFGKLCRNMSIHFADLRMPRQSHRFGQLAVKHGNITEKDLNPPFLKSLRRILVDAELLQWAWEGFEKDLINCWPSPYFERRVLVARPVEEEKTTE